MAGLSTRGSYRIVAGATHMSLAYREDNAHVCINGMLEILKTVRNTEDLSRVTE
jgi:hypothetical protein